MELAIRIPHTCLARIDPHAHDKHTHADFVVSVSDSNSDEKVTPPLQPSSPRTTQTGLGRAPV